MGYRCGQLNVTHSLSSHLGLRDFNAALVAYDAFVSDSLVFTAVALPVLCRSENPLAVKSVHLRLQGPVVDRFRLGDLTVGPASDLFRGSKSDLQGFKIVHFVVCILTHFVYPLLLVFRRINIGSAVCLFYRFDIAFIKVPDLFLLDDLEVLFFVFV